MLSNIEASFLLSNGEASFLLSKDLAFSLIVTHKTFLMFEEPNIKICRCVKGDIDQHKVEVNITFHTPINLDTGLFKLQLLIYYFSVTCAWLML